MGWTTASCIHRWPTSVTWTAAMWSSCVWTSLYQAMKTFRRGGTRGERQSCNSTQTFSKWTLLRDLVGGVHATCGLINPDHPRMWKWLTGRTGYPQIELKPGGASITVTGALESLEVVLELWGVLKNMHSMRANNVVVVAWCTPTRIHRSRVAKFVIVSFCECWYVFHDSGELKTLNESPCFKFINWIITILEWFSFESLSHRFQSSWIFAARRGGGSNPRCVVAPVVVRSNPPGVAGGSCCTPVGCLPCGVETWSRDMYSTAFGAIKTFMSQSFYTQIGKNMLDHSLRSQRSYNFTMICCHPWTMSSTFY